MIGKSVIEKISIKTFQLEVIYRYWSWWIKLNYMNWLQPFIVYKKIFIWFNLCVSWQHIKKPSFSGIILNWASRVLIYRVLRTKANFLFSLLLGKPKRKSMAHRPDLHLRLGKRKGAPSAPSTSPSRGIPVKTSPTFCLLRPMKKVQLINHGKLTTLSPWFLGIVPCIFTRSQ